MDIIVAQLLREFADALGCAPDNEVILAQIGRLTAERDAALEACRIARIHAPSIRLAPERRYTIEVLDKVLNPTEQFAGKPCSWCGAVHEGACGRMISGGQSD